MVRPRSHCELVPDDGHTTLTGSVAQMTSWKEALLRRTGYTYGTDTPHSASIAEAQTGGVHLSRTRLAHRRNPIHTGALTAAQIVHIPGSSLIHSLDDFKCSHTTHHRPGAPVSTAPMQRTAIAPHSVPTLQVRRVASRRQHCPWSRGRSGRLGKMGGGEAARSGKRQTLEEALLLLFTIYSLLAVRLELAASELGHGDAGHALPVVPLAEEVGATLLQLTTLLVQRA